MGLLDVLVSGKMKNVPQKASPASPASPSRGEAGEAGDAVWERVSTKVSWPSASLDAERRFGQPHAKLYPFLNQKVRTPEGPGILLQVFADRATVLLDRDRDGASTQFYPDEIRPVAEE